MDLLQLSESFTENIAKKLCTNTVEFLHIYRLGERLI